MNESTQTQPHAFRAVQTGRGRLTAVIAAIKDILLGEADPAMGARAAARTGVEGDLMPSKAPRGTLIANAL